MTYIINTISQVGIYTAILLGVAAVAGWATHIWWLLTMLFKGPDSWAVGHAAIALLGIFIPPIGSIHGVMIWFGGGA